MFEWFIYCFPGGYSGKESTCQAGNEDSIPGLGRSPGVGNSNPLQYSCLENSMDKEAWRATVPGVTKELDTTEPEQKDKWGLKCGLHSAGQNMR